ncbi:MAG TPA: cellulose binding domain-containing protein [Bacillota bacterium]|nr:cellulose binding domain-containing protein [Bacillota bacterium]
MGKRHSIILLALVLLIAIIAGNSISAASTATVAWNTLKQPIDGFGISEAFHQAACINQFPEPKRTEILDLLFSTTKGSGFSILRNMVGDGGTWGNATDGPLATIEPSQGVWSWNESNDDQIPLMNTIKTNYGVTRFMSTVWSPPAWMKTNNSVINGGNVATNMYQAYADYLAEYCNGYKSHFGIDIYAISMANEPNLSTGYSSCQWDSTKMTDFIANYVKPTFQTKNVTAKFMAGEESGFTESMVSGALNNTNAASRIDIVGAHSYGSNATVLSTTKSKGKRLWETEVSNLNNNDASITDGLSWARKVHDFMTISEVNAFFYWWGACYKTNNGEGLIRMDMNAKTYSADKRLYTIGNYSRFVRPGWNRIDATASPTSNVYVTAYKDDGAGKFAIVAINSNGSASDVTFSFSGVAPASVTPYRTSSTENLAQLTAITLSGGSFTASLAANSVTSFVGAANGTVTPTPTINNLTPTPTINNPTPTPTINNPTPTRRDRVDPTPSQRVTPTPTRVNTPTPTNPQGGYVVTYTIQSDWGVGATISITIKNNSTAPINGWTLAFTFPGNQKITNLWNGTYTQSGASVSVKDAGYNANIPANGGSTNFGFNLSYSGTNAKPTAFTLNGTACQVQ